MKPMMASGLSSRQAVLQRSTCISTLPLLHTTIFSYSRLTSFSLISYNQHGDIRLKRLLAFLIGVVLIYPVAAMDTVLYKKEAAALCEVYKPAIWQEFIKNHKPEEMLGELRTRLNQAVATEEFRVIVKKHFGEEGSTGGSSAVAQEVSQLFGEKWDCAYFNAFYQVSEVCTVIGEKSYCKPVDANTKPRLRKEIQLSLKGIAEVSPLQNGEEVIVGVDTDGNLYVDANPLKNKEMSTLIQAIKLITKIKKPKIVIRADSRAPYAAFVTIFEAAKLLGITKLSIETL